MLASFPGPRSKHKEQVQQGHTQRTDRSQNCTRTRHTNVRIERYGVLDRASSSHVPDKSDASEGARRVGLITVKYVSVAADEDTVNAVTGDGSEGTGEVIAS